MNIWKKVLTGMIGITGILMIFYSVDKTITGNVVGVNTNSQIIGFVGIILMTLSMIIQRYQLNNK